MAQYSYSKLGTYATCPLQYKFRYIDRVRVDVGPGIEAFMGSLVHDVLEWVYEQVGHGVVPSWPAVRTHYHALWEEKWTDDMRIVRKAATPEGYRRVGEQCLERYYGRHAPFGEGVVLGLEVSFEFPLEDGIVLRGYLDRLSKPEDGVYEVHDYKTSTRLPTPEEAARDEQAGWYALATQMRFPHAQEVRLVWHYLRHDERLVTTRTPLELEALKHDIVRRVREIETASAFPPQESALCPWCDYLTICPAKGHRLAVEALPENAYLGEPGVELVDRLAALKTELAAYNEERKREIARVEEALQAYARQHGYTVVVGSEMEAVIDEREILALPRAGEAERPGLEALVRDAGLWEAFSSLSLDKLRKAMHERALPEDLHAHLEQLGREEPRTSVRLRRR